MCRTLIDDRNKCRGSSCLADTKNVFPTQHTQAQRCDRGGGNASTRTLTLGACLFALFIELLEASPHVAPLLSLPAIAPDRVPCRPRARTPPRPMALDLILHPLPSVARFWLMRLKLRSSTGRVSPMKHENVSLWSCRHFSQLLPRCNTSWSS